jgi:hypothetical protein
MAKFRIMFSRPKPTGAWPIRPDSTAGSDSTLLFFLCAAFEDCDAHFPAIPAETFALTSSGERLTQNGINFCFQTYTRREVVRDPAATPASECPNRQPTAWHAPDPFV